MDGFGNFVYSFGAARELLKRAHRSGSLIEGIVLYVSLIDGLLRMAIILDKQLQSSDDSFDISYIEQQNTGPKYSERQIFEEASRRSIIDAKFKEELADLYEQRNAVIHRFFLTGIKYVDLEPWLGRYEQAFERCYGIVDDLESRQLADGKGMTTSGPKADRRSINKVLNEKIGIDIIST
jgi:uncharacterized protein YutE (UPF0331/DUF86 family)